MSQPSPERRYNNASLEKTHGQGGKRQHEQNLSFLGQCMSPATKRPKHSNTALELTADCRLMNPNTYYSQPAAVMGLNPCTQPPAYMQMPHFIPVVGTHGVPGPAQFPAGIQLAPVYYVPQQLPEDVMQAARSHILAGNAARTSSPAAHNLSEKGQDTHAACSDESAESQKDAAKRLLAKQSSGKCALQDIREKFSSSNVRLLDGDAKCPPPYRGVEISTEDLDEHSIDMASNILAEVFHIASQDKDCKVFLVVKKGQAGPIIGKGGQGITHLRQQYGDTSIRVIDNAKTTMPSLFKLGSGVNPGDDAIQVDCKHADAAKLLQDIAPRLMHFQAKQRVQRSHNVQRSTTPVKHVEGRQAKQEHGRSQDTRPKKEDCVRLIKLYITNKQKQALMANKWTLMNSLRATFPTAYLRLLDDPKEMKKGMRALEIGVRSHSEMGALDKLEAEISGLEK